MASLDTLGRITGEDLMKWRNIYVRYRSLEFNPHAYSKDESEQIVKLHAEFFGEVADRFGMDCTRNYGIDYYSGEVFYTD